MGTVGRPGDSGSSGGSTRAVGGSDGNAGTTGNRAGLGESGGGGGGSSVDCRSTELAARFGKSLAFSFFLRLDDGDDDAVDDDLIADVVARRAGRSCRCFEPVTHTHQTSISVETAAKYNSYAMLSCGVVWAPV